MRAGAEPSRPGTAGNTSPDAAASLGDKQQTVTCAKLCLRLKGTTALPEAACRLWPCHGSSCRDDKIQTRVRSWGYWGYWGLFGLFGKPNQHQVLFMMYNLTCVVIIDVLCCVCCKTGSASSACHEATDFGC